MAETNIENNEILVDFRRIASTELEAFVQAASSFGGLMQNLAQKIQRAFTQEYRVIKSAITMRRPSTPVDLNALMAPVIDCVRDISDFYQSNRHEEEFFNHLSMIANSIEAVLWIVMEGPTQHIRAMKETADYYGNRVLAAHRREQKHVSFVNAWRSVLTALETYIVDHHKMGFSWGAARRGGHVPVDLDPRSSGDATAAPVPPPPPPAPAAAAVPEPGMGDADRTALFNQINAKGANIADMLRPSRSVHTMPRRLAVEQQQQQQQPTVVNRPPPPASKFILEGKKWCLEHLKDNYALTLECNDMSESLVMFKCENIGLEVRNKMNGITIDSTKKSHISLSHVISAVELIRCSNMKITCTGAVPMINIDKCDSIEIYLTHEALAMELITSNSTSLNVCVLNDDGTYKEHPVPEQLRSVLSAGNLFTNAVQKH